MTETLERELLERLVALAPRVDHLTRGAFAQLVADDFATVAGIDRVRTKIECSATDDRWRIRFDVLAGGEWSDLFFEFDPARRGIA